MHSCLRTLPGWRAPAARAPDALRFAFLHALHRAFAWLVRSGRIGASSVVPPLIVQAMVTTSYIDGSADAQAASMSLRIFVESASLYSLVFCFIYLSKQPETSDACLSGSRAARAASFQALLPWSEIWHGVSMHEQLYAPHTC